MTLSSRSLALGLVVFAGLASAADSDPYFPKPSYFKKYFARTVTKVELQPPVKLEDYLIDGTLELSLKSFLDLVMANNPNVLIQKLSLVVNEDGIMRAFGSFDAQAFASF